MPIRGVNVPQTQEARDFPRANASLDSAGAMQGRSYAPMSVPAASVQGPQGEAQPARTVIMGAGPAGLTAAYELMRYRLPSVILEKDPKFVGGISRTESYNGYRFDIGGHRFFSKSQEVENFWTEILGDELLTCGRLSRILYNGKYYDYPLKAFNALANMGPIQTVISIASYAKAKLFPYRDPQNLQEWVTNQFGFHLFSIFFKTYTEKVWGIPCTEVSADWAAQRIKGLDLATAIKNALLPQRKPKSGNRGAVIKTLIDEFRYPKYGPGEMWERVAQKVREGGNVVGMGQEVVAVKHDGARVTTVAVRDTATGRIGEVSGTNFISTLPIRELIHKLTPVMPAHVMAAADDLKYRDFLTVALVLRKKDVFPDNWIYIHDPQVKVGRMQNFKSWSPYLVPDQNTTCIGLEYFCFEGDGLWTSTNEQLVALATREMAQLGLCMPEDVMWGVAVRQPKAYPVYDDTYKKDLRIIHDYLAERLPNLQLVGRNGMHHYNNQDHSMMTALLVARNIATGSHFDQWKVNTDAEYHEESRIEDEDKSGRLVPTRAQMQSLSDK
jgi:protoporphyrinogen oxidase